MSTDASSTTYSREEALEIAAIACRFVINFPFQIAELLNLQPENFYFSPHAEETPCYIFSAKMKVTMGVVSETVTLESLVGPVKTYSFKISCPWTLSLDEKYAIMGYYHSIPTE